MLSCNTHPPGLSRKGQTALPGTPEEPEPAGRLYGNTFLRNQLIFPSIGSLEIVLKPRRCVAGNPGPPWAGHFPSLMHPLHPLMRALSPSPWSSVMHQSQQERKVGESPLLMQGGYKEKDGLQPHWASHCGSGAVGGSYRRSSPHPTLLLQLCPPRLVARCAQG